MATVQSLVPEAIRFLTKVASERRLVTYGEVAAAIGTHHRVVPKVLWKIHDRCAEHGWPPLTALVVRKNAPLPGEGFLHELESNPREQAAKWSELLRAVYDFDWEVAFGAGRREPAPIGPGRHPCA